MAKKGEVVQNLKPELTGQTLGEIKGFTKATDVNDEEKQELIGKAAYYRAERRGFIPGFELEDWLAAEHEINGSLRTIPTGHRSKQTQSRRTSL